MFSPISLVSTPSPASTPSLLALASSSPFRPPCSALLAPSSQVDHELLIEAGHTERNYWRDLFRYRELFYFLAWRDVLVRYKQTVIGILWAVLRPFLTMVIFVFVFSRVACREILASHRNRETVSSIVTTNDRNLPNEAFAIAKQLHEGLAAEQVYLYGSHACGEETASSDLDFLVRCAALNGVALRTRRSGSANCW